jgi:hypothetical protein
MITNVYDDGSVFSPEVLDLTDEDLIDKFASGVSMVLQSRGTRTFLLLLWRQIVRSC